MTKKLTVIPEQCSDCRICELVCSIKHFGVNNPKKAAIRVINTYPHPVMRMPVVCSQCRVPTCAQACPTDSLRWVDGIVLLDRETCISCFKCVEACPFDALYLSHAFECAKYRCEDTIQGKDEMRETPERKVSGYFYPDRAEKLPEQTLLVDKITEKQ